MRRTIYSALAVLVLASPSAAQKRAPNDTVHELAAVRAEVARMQEDLETIKAQLGQALRLLNQRQAPLVGAAVAPTGPARASVTGAPFLGRADAPVTIVEFSDYQCPFCQRFYATTLPALKTEYIDAGKVRYVFRDYPLDQLHPLARKAAEAAHCAAEQGKFWEMHDALFSHPGALSLSQLTEHARSIGLDTQKFDDCVASARYAARVDRGVADGAVAGVRGTPGFVIGRGKVGADVVEGTPVRGAQPLEAFRRIIDQMLAQP